MDLELSNSSMVISMMGNGLKGLRMAEEFTSMLQLRLSIVVNGDKAKKKVRAI